MIPNTVSVATFATRVDEGQQLYYRVSHNGHTGDALQVTVVHTEAGNAVSNGNLGSWIHVIPAGESGLTRAFTSEAGDGSDGDAEFKITVAASEDYVVDPDASHRHHYRGRQGPAPPDKAPREHGYGQ